jgi:hypothetical protein
MLDFYFEKHLHIHMIVQEHQARLLYQNPNYKVSQAKKNEQYYIPIHMNHTHLLYNWHEQDALQTEKRTPPQFFLS